MQTRRTLLAQFTGLLALGPATLLAESNYPRMQVWKSPTCGCCSKWVTHMQNAGFDVTATNVPNVGPYKAEAGLPPDLASCHTAMVAGYFVEGHVPAEDVVRMLEERADIAGLAVPGMPLGSPGMESSTPEAYDVMAVGKDGSVTVFAHHPVVA